MHADGLGLDGDALFAFQIHLVEHLVGHLALRQGSRVFQQAICQGGFAMIDMRDDAKITNMCLIDTTPVGRAARAVNHVYLTPIRPE